MKEKYPLKEYRTTKWEIYKIDEFEFVKDIEGTEDIQV